MLDDIACLISPSHKEMCMRALLALCLLYATYTYASDTSPPDLMLATIYQQNIDISEYWVSEKLDGVRAYWNGSHLVTRQGNIIRAPDWFLAPLPRAVKLDGELWIARGQFEKISAIVRSHSVPDHTWQNVSYQLFDMPVAGKTFTQRLQEMSELFADNPQAHINVIRQFKLDSHQALMDALNDYVAQGSEGLMLHRGAAYYRSGRNSDLLKLKPYMDAEARVIKHFPGKGKYSGMMGSILVEDEQGIQFRIGTGFTEKQRRSPPAIGKLISYKYFGRTSKGRPRFASFLRIRPESTPP